MGENMLSRLLGAGRSQMDFEQAIETQVDRYVLTMFAGKHAVIGARGHAKVIIMRSLLKAFELANEVVDLEEGGKVYVAFPFAVDFNDERWPWLSILHCKNDAAYTRIIKTFDDLIQHIRQSHNVKADYASSSALIFVVPKELKVKTRVEIAKTRKKGETGAFGMRVFTTELCNGSQFSKSLRD